MEVKTIRVRDIIDDEFFRFSSKTDTTLITRSIQRIGVQSPLTMIFQDGKYRLMAGFNRLDAVRALGIDTVPARVHPDDASIAEHFGEVIEAQCSIRPINLVEKARILRIFEKIGTELRSLPPGLIDLLQLPAHDRSLQRVLKLLELTPAVLYYIQKYGLSLKQTECFEGLSAEDQDMAVDMALDLGLRGVELAELLHWVRDISIREDLPFETIIRNDRINALLNDTECPRSQRVQRLKALLWKQRYPRLSGWNERLETLNKTLHLPEQVRIFWDPAMERAGLQMNMRFRSLEQLDTIIETLASEENRRVMETMLEDV